MICDNENNSKNKSLKKTENMLVSSLVSAQFCPNLESLASESATEAESLASESDKLNSTNIKIQKCCQFVP